MINFHKSFPVKRALFLSFYILLIPFFHAINSDTEEKQAEPESASKYSFLAYGGPYVNSDLLPISIYGDIAYKRSFIGVIGLNRKLDLNYKFRSGRTTRKA